MDRIYTFFLSIVFGLLIGTLIKQTDIYKGPNAHDFCRHIYYDPIKKKCYKFSIQII